MGEAIVDEAPLTLEAMTAFLADGCKSPAAFRVGAEQRPWVEGEPWIFDDTIEHEAMNPSDRLRVILILDTWHPDLSPAERLAVSAILAASDAGGGAQAL